MINVIKPPTKIIPDQLQNISLFLGGSIEMGTAEDWQSRLVSDLSVLNFDLTVYNPRRDDWDSTWLQVPENDQFREQVEWEMLAQDVCDVNVYYFSPDTKSPVTLLELGGFGRHNKTVVFCPRQFWRYGNVHLFCERRNIKMFTEYFEFKQHLIQHLKSRKQFYFNTTY